MRSALALHDELLRDAIEAHGGHVVKSTGDGTFAVFGNADDGVGAAVDAQLALAGAEWPEGAGLRVRMGLHIGRGDGAVTATTSGLRSTARRG